MEWKKTLYLSYNPGYIENIKEVEKDDNIFEFADTKPYIILKIPIIRKILEPENSLKERILWKKQIKVGK